MQALCGMIEGLFCSAGRKYLPNHLLLIVSGTCSPHPPPRATIPPDAPSCGPGLIVFGKNRFGDIYPTAEDRSLSSMNPRRPSNLRLSTTDCSLWGGGGNWTAPQLCRVEGQTADMGESLEPRPC